MKMLDVTHISSYSLYKSEKYVYIMYDYLYSVPVMCSVSGYGNGVQGKKYANTF